MNWSFLIAFAIGLGIYFVGLTVFAIIKYNINKRKVKKEILLDEQSEEVQNEVINTKE